MITVSVLDRLKSFVQEEAPFLTISAERHDLTGKEWTYFNIKLKKSKYIYSENHPLNVTKELTQDIENFLRNEGVKKLRWNNTYTTFWESE